MSEIQIQSTDVIALEKMAEVFAGSGYFDRTNIAQATTKLILGRSIGLTEYEAMTQLNIFQGKIHVGTLVMASRVKSSGKYDYKSVTNDKQSTVIFFQKNETGGWSEIGDKTYTIEMAQRAGLASRDVWKKFPEAMLNARAMSAGIREHCPDVFGGAPVYSYEHGEAECESPLKFSQQPAEMIEHEVIDQEPLPNDEHKDKAQSLRSRVIEHNLGAEVTSFIEKVSESSGTKITKLDELDPSVLDSLSTMVETKIQSKRLEAQGA